MKKAAILLVMMTIIVNTNSANKKTGVAAGTATACNKDTPNDIISYRYIYAGMPVAYNCY